MLLTCPCTVDNDDLARLLSWDFHNHEYEHWISWMVEMPEVLEHSLMPWFQRRVLAEAEQHIPRLLRRSDDPKSCLAQPSKIALNSGSSCKSSQSSMYSFQSSVERGRYYILKLERISLPCCGWLHIQFIHFMVNPGSWVLVSAMFSWNCLRNHNTHVKGDTLCQSAYREELTQHELFKKHKDCCLGFSIGSLLAESGGIWAAPAKEVVQNQGGARKSEQQAAKWTRTRRKIRLISWGSMSPVSDIKLIRTDTTLDLSQKAEKGMLLYPLPIPLIPTYTMCLSSPEGMGQTKALHSLEFTLMNLRRCSTVLWDQWPRSRCDKSAYTECRACMPFTQDRAQLLHY
jgi:hypothetical protein